MRSDLWQSSRQEGELLYAERAFSWVPDLGSFLKLLEVGVSPYLGYLGFIPSLSTLRMFESIEAVRGRLIGPKPWNRINMNLLKPKCAASERDGAVWVIIA